MTFVEFEHRLKPEEGVQTVDVQVVVTGTLTEPLTVTITTNTNRKQTSLIHIIHVIFCRAKMI